jgi:hypothetical protein
MKCVDSNDLVNRLYGNYENSRSNENGKSLKQFRSFINSSITVTYLNKAFLYIRNKLYVLNDKYKDIHKYSCTERGIKLLTKLETTDYRNNSFQRH